MTPKQKLKDAEYKAQNGAAVTPAEEPKKPSSVIDPKDLPF
jgi:hypothetical protein